MKTAIDWLIDQYKKDDGKFMPGVYEQAKEKEKEQIINAWIATDNELQRLAGEQYYNQTYNQNK